MDLYLNASGEERISRQGLSQGRGGRCTMTVNVYKKKEVKLKPHPTANHKRLEQAQG